MSLLRDIQEAAIDGHTELSTVLRKCKVLAVRLDHEQFAKWVDWELNGYPGDAELPSYRVFKNMQSIGDFAGAFGSGIKNQPLPILNIPEEPREYFEAKDVRDGIATCENWARADGNLAAPWPPDMVAQLSDRFIGRMNLMAARMIIPASLFVGLVDAVRNRLLSFVLEIEKIAPGAGEAQPGQLPVRPERVTQVFNTNIYGTSGNVAVGSQDVKQIVQDLVVAPGDLDSLKRSLKSLDVDATDIDRLTDIIREDPNADHSDSIAPSSKIKGWIADMAVKAAQGVWSTVVPEATKVLVKVVYGYLGIGDKG